jgi:hypothetical protein
VALSSFCEENFPAAVSNAFPSFDTGMIVVVPSSPTLSGVPLVVEGFLGDPPLDLDLAAPTGEGDRAAGTRVWYTTESEASNVVSTRVSVSVLVERDESEVVRERLRESEAPDVT